MKPPSQRVPELDGLRGLAALSVFFSHFVGLHPGYEQWPVQHTILHVAWDGAGAVTLFFVLSGYVLTLPFSGTHAKKNEWVPFIIQRLTRLYPAYWFALLFSLALRAFVLGHGSFAGVSGWAASLWAVPLSGKMILKQFAMIAPGIDTHGIDPVIWSLVMEMKVSLIFPAVIFLVSKTSRLAYAVAIMAALIAISPHLRSLAVLPLFVAGSYLAKYRESVLPWCRRLPVAAKCAAVMVALLFYGNAWLRPSSDQVVALITGAGSAMLILLFPTFPLLSRIATTAPVRLLGAVSYSFYLLHLPILLTVTALLFPRVHSIALCATVALAAALGVSKLVFDWIEIPWQERGKQLARRIRRAPRAVPAET